MRATWAPRLLAVAFATSGVTHLVRPQVFADIVPRFLPRPRELVYLSGVAELACALGLVRRSRWASGASTALLLGVWPANLQMAVDARHGTSTAYEAAAWARMPLQIPMIWAARQCRARPDGLDTVARYADRD